MPEATFENTTPPRRAILAGIVGAFAAPVVATAASAGEGAHPDTQLLRLRPVFDEAAAREDAAWDAAAHEVSGPATDLADEIDFEVTEIVQQIVETPAHTLDGLLFKARVMSWCRAGRPYSFDDQNFGDQPTTHCRLLLSVMTDLSAIAEAGA